jgi:peroxiredoxin
LVAGLTKLVDLTGSQRALRDFGVPIRLAAPLGLLLPLAELAVAIALLPSAWAWWGAVGALALLLVFVVGISYNLARGRTPDCHCFGQLHSAPAGWLTLLRNLVLAALAACITWFGRPSAGPGVLDWLAPLTAAEHIELLSALILCVLLIGFGWLLFEIMTQQGRLLLRIEAAEARLAEAGLGTRALPSRGSVAGLAVGTPAPAFRLSDLDGGEVTLSDLRPSDKALVLLFSDPDCGPCAAIFPEVGRWQRDAASRLAIAVVSRGSVEANQALATPSAVLIDREGKIGSPLAQGAEAIRSLVASAFGGYPLNTLPILPMTAQRNGNGSRPTLPVALKIGDVAPAFSLPDLAGHLVHLSDFRGSTTLVLFWRPGCGFCQRMLAALRAWEAQPQEGAPRLLVVSTESVQDNQAMGLRSPIVLDQATIRVGSLFGATGTPMAVLIDAEGKIASELAAGAPAVLAQLRLPQEKTATA